MSAVDESLWLFLSDELLVLPAPPPVPRFAADTVRPPAKEPS